MVMAIVGFSFIGWFTSIMPSHILYLGFPLRRPRSNQVTLSLLNRAKENNYKALVVTLDTMSIGWRPHDLETSYIPFIHGVGVQVGMSDPMFMARYKKQPVTNQHPEFPYDPAKFDRKSTAGDPKVQEETFLGMEWLKEVHAYHDWEDLKFLRDNWEGPLVLKGILNIHVCFILFNHLTGLRLNWSCSGRGEGANVRRRRDCHIQSR
jgi:isopentenyl diphosphate isomerase/L-lactate dehydrogenase-like FMN-dependent dehydrogenase